MQKANECPNRPPRSPKKARQSGGTVDAATSARLWHWPSSQLPQKSTQETEVRKTAKQHRLRPRRSGDTISTQVAKAIAYQPAGDEVKDRPIRNLKRQKGGKRRKNPFTFELTITEDKRQNRNPPAPVQQSTPQQTEPPGTPYYIDALPHELRLALPSLTLSFHPRLTISWLLVVQSTPFINPNPKNPITSGTIFAQHQVLGVSHVRYFISSHF